VGVSRPERVRQLVDLANHQIPEHVWEALEDVGPVEGDPEAGH